MVSCIVVAYAIGILSLARFCENNEEFEELASTAERGFIKTFTEKNIPKEIVEMLHTNRLKFASFTKDYSEVGKEVRKSQDHKKIQVIEKNKIRSSVEIGTQVENNLQKEPEITYQRLERGKSKTLNQPPIVIDLRDSDMKEVQEINISPRKEIKKYKISSTAKEQTETPDKELPKYNSNPTNTHTNTKDRFFKKQIKLLEAHNDDLRKQLDFMVNISKSHLTPNNNLDEEEVKLETSSFEAGKFESQVYDLEKELNKSLDRVEQDSVLIDEEQVRGYRGADLIRKKLEDSQGYRGQSFEVSRRRRKKS